MATLSNADSKRMYSWWWNSHISPKNSKWLQENLTDMDDKIKAMIKLINEDADSFARRAEMYYKKRPEFMKLVEEFYRAYRALAERYDNATVVIRQAHRTMAEAFPNQVPLVLDDSASEVEPHTPDMSPMHALLDSDDLQNDAIGLSSYRSHANKRNGDLTAESGSLASGNGLKQIGDPFGSGNHGKFSEGRVRRALNFQEGDQNEVGVQSNENFDLQAVALSHSELVNKAEEEVAILKEALSKLEAEKEAGLVQYQQCLDKLSKLESEISRAQEDSKGLGERASKAEAEAQSLMEAIAKLEAEKEVTLQEYQQSMDRITDLENIMSLDKKSASELNQKVSKLESDTTSLNEELLGAKAERDAALHLYKQSIDMISNLESKLEQVEEDSRRFCELSVKAEEEIETLKQAMAELTEEKEAAALQYLKCLETISTLELKLTFAEEEIQRLNKELDTGIAKLKGVEERCLLLERSNQSLQSEVDSLVPKIGSQSQELKESRAEIGKLWTCIQEERLRFVEAETAFQTLQRLHSQTQEQLGSLATELQNRVHILRDMETHNQNLQDEIIQIKEENKNLSDLNLASAVSIKEMEQEIVCLRDTKGQLEQEVELRLDQRNALQQEIYCLREQLNEVNEKHSTIIKKLDAVGLNPDCVQSSVKEMQEQISHLQEIFQREKSEKEALLSKLEVLKQLLDKNAVLENSLSHLSAELEAVRGKVKKLEESYQDILEEKHTLIDEKSALTSRLQATNENLEELSEKNMIMENSLSNVQDELEGLKAKSKDLENSCQVLDNQKASLICEKSNLFSQLDATQQELNNLNKRYTELQDMFLFLKEEKVSALRKVEELQVMLDEERRHAQLRETNIAGLESQMHFLLEERQSRKMEFEKELDKSLDSQMENFILQRCVHDMQEKNIFLTIECQKLLDESKISEALVFELKKNNQELKIELQSLFDQTTTMRTGLNQLLNALDISVVDAWSNDKIAFDNIHLENVLDIIQERKTSLCQSEEENQQLKVEKSVLFTLIGQLVLQAENLAMENYLVEQEFGIKSEQLSALQSEFVNLEKQNGNLSLELTDRDNKLKILTIDRENMQGKMLDVEKSCQNLQKENLEMLEENKSLTKEFLLLGEKNRNIEEENSIFFNESLFLGNLSLIFKNYVDEKSYELRELREVIDDLHEENGELCQKLSSMQKTFDEVQAEKLLLSEALEKLEDRLKDIASEKDQLSCEVADGKNLLHLKEMELLESGHKLIEAERDKLVLHNAVEDMEKKYDAVQIIRNGQEEKILKLSEEYDCLRKENACLFEENLKLDSKLHQLHEESEKTRIREECMFSELEKIENEKDIWKTQALASFGELQVENTWHTLFEDKLNELSKSCKGLEEENTSKNVHIELLKERVNNLESEKDNIKSHLTAYEPAVCYLKDCVASLENKVCLQIKTLNSNGDTKDAEVSSLSNESHNRRDQNTMECGVLLELQDLQTRIIIIEKEAIEKERLMGEDKLNLQTRLEAAMKEIEGLKSENSSHGIYVKPYETEAGLTTKDIMLDQISECSSYGNRRRISEDDNRALELWEDCRRDGSIGLTVGKTKKVFTASEKEADYRPSASEKRMSKLPTSDMIIEKDLGVDKLETSKRSMDRQQEGSKRKVLERLNSDVQKLTNLQTAVQDLKRKLQSAEKTKKGKTTLDCATLKEQLEEAETAILKLFNLHGKLWRNIEDSPSSGRQPGIELDDRESIGRKKISEQARRMSEKIGRLQVEVQKIRFVLSELDDGIESQGKNRISEVKRRVLLRDYLYGGVKANHKGKRTYCCACMRPPTKD